MSAQPSPIDKLGALWADRNVRGAVVVLALGAAFAIDFFDYPIQTKGSVAVAAIVLIVVLTVGAVRRILITPEGAAKPRPVFADDWPKHDKLDVLLAAFEAGDFAFVREHAGKLAKETDDPEIEAAAQELRRRIEPSPTSLYLWALGVALLVFLYAYFVSHAH